MRARRLAHVVTATVLAAGAVTSAPLAAESSAAPARSQHSASATTVRHHRTARMAQLRTMTHRQTPAHSGTVAAVTRAVRGSEFTQGVPASWYTVRDLKVSGSWARATLRPTPGADIDPATVVLHRTGTTWRVMDLGTAEVGCGVAPAATLERLALTCG